MSDQLEATDGVKDEIQLIARARSHGNDIALRSGSHEKSYNGLLERSIAIANALLIEADDLNEAPIAFLPTSDSSPFLQDALAHRRRGRR